MPLDLRKLSGLVKDVFHTPQGKVLLEALSEQTALVLDTNTNAMYINASQNDFVQQLKILSNLGEADFKEAEEIGEDTPDSLFDL